MPSLWYAKYSFITSFSVRRGRCARNVLRQLHEETIHLKRLSVLRLYTKPTAGQASDFSTFARHQSNYYTNLLEDEDEELYVLRSSDLSDGFGCALSLSFRKVDVKTIKLVLVSPIHKIFDIISNSRFFIGRSDCAG